MNGKGFTNALRCSDCIVKSLQRGSSTASRRTFTSSAIQKGIPTFTKTTSPELDEVLSKFRTNVFLPHHLSVAHRKLVYEDKYANVLLSDPVEVEIDGETFGLQHLNRTVDEPSSTKGLFEAAALMQNKTDFDNLPRLLEGYRQIGRKLKLYSKIKLIKLAGRKEQIGVILECARRGKTTNFTLTHPGVVKELMSWIQGKALASNWTPKQTAQALRWAEIVSGLLEEPTHRPSNSHSDVPDVRALPELLGVMLELSAVRAVQHLNGKDEDGKVVKYAERLMATSVDIKPTDVVSTFQPSHPYYANRWLVMAVPVIHGMKTALTVLDPALGVYSRLASKLQELELKAATFAAEAEQRMSNAAEERSPGADETERQAANTKVPRGLQMYSQLLTPLETVLVA